MRIRRNKDEAPAPPKKAPHPEGWHWTLRYQREDGEIREISLRAHDHDSAVEFADRRLKEQYGPHPRSVNVDRVDANGVPLYDEKGYSIIDVVTVHDQMPVHKGVERPDLCQSNYKLVDVRGPE